MLCGTAKKLKQKEKTERELGDSWYPRPTTCRLPVKLCTPLHTFSDLKLLIVLRLREGEEPTQSHTAPARFIVAMGLDLSFSSIPSFPPSFSPSSNSYFFFPCCCFKMPRQKDEVARRSRKMLREGEGEWERMKCQVKRPNADKQHQGVWGSWVRLHPGTPGGGMAPFSFRGLRMLLPALVCLTQPIFFYNYLPEQVYAISTIRWAR